MNNKMFNKALSNFTYDVASGDAIRHLVDNDYTVRQISEMLDYPTPYNRIQQIVWDYMVQKGDILLENPVDKKQESYEYVREYDEFGHASFRRVKKQCDEKDISDYIVCDFGKLKYQNENAFNDALAKLDSLDKEYIEGIPWPLQTVWCKKTDRINRIYKTINNDK